LALTNCSLTMYGEKVKTVKRTLPLTGKDLQAIVALRVRKEFKTVSQFVWAAIVYQTVALIRRVGKLYRPLSAAPGSLVPDLFHKVEEEYTRLADFFRFKKCTDWIGAPVSCAIIVLVTFTPGREQ
jgi:hypothetical protein